MKENPVKILIADDHKLIRETWSYLLNAEPDFEVIADTGDAEDAVAMALQKKPDIVLMDINILPINGFEATKKIIEADPEIKIIAVSMISQAITAKKMMSLGARGYVTKQSSRQEMIKAIKEVQSGNKYICDEIRNLVVEQMMTENAEHSINDLSDRELEIVNLLKKGKSSKEIAADLSISIKTVEVHRYNILKKLNIKNTVELINYISQYGI